MSTISPERLSEELRLRDKSQNYSGILNSISLATQQVQLEVQQAAIQ